MRKALCKFFAICTLACTVYGCGHDELTPEDENQIRWLIDNLGIQTGPTWARVCQRLVEQYGPKAVPHLIENLGSTNSNIRRGCAYCLGHIGDREAIDRLRQRLGDPDVMVRLECAASLCMMEEYDGVELLILALRHDETLVRCAAIQTLAGSFQQDFDYDPKASSEARAPAVERWEAWWAQNQGKLAE